MISDEEAKVAGKALDVVSGTGRFLDRVFGGIIVDSVGIVADKIKFVRLTKYLELVNRAEALLHGRPHLRPVPPKFALELIEEATLESSHELSELWARLLANAMDANGVIEPRMAFISILKEMSPQDARLLQLLATYCDPERESRRLLDVPGCQVEMRSGAFRRHVGDFATIESAHPDHHKMSLYTVPDDEFLAWQNLQRLGCVHLNQMQWANAVGLTHLGAALLRSVSMPPEKG